MRYAIDALVAIEIARGLVPVHESHRLVGPGRLRSDAMAVLYAAVRAGALSDDEVRDAMTGLTELKFRALNDRVTRAVAWKIAAARDWEDLAPAEYLSVAHLQADALVATDPAVLAGASGLVDVAPLEALGRSAG